MNPTCQLHVDDLRTMFVVLSIDLEARDHEPGEEEELEKLLKRIEVEIYRVDQGRIDAARGGA